jgi:hypothetical protein
MPDIGFKDHHVRAILDGSKPFTLRRAWKNGRTPDLGDTLRLVTGSRTPNRRVFATAVVQFRATVLFGEDGFRDMRSWRKGLFAAPLATTVRNHLQRSRKASRRAGESTMLALLDGFPDYAAFWQFHAGHRAKGAGPTVERELIGLGMVTEEFGA